MKIAGAVLAGGVGRRMSTALPKQFLPVKGRPIIFHTLKTFLDSGIFQSLAVAIHPDWRGPLLGLLQEEGWDKAIRVVLGGETRQASSFAVLQAMADSMEDDDIVVIHDAARCLVDADLLGRCLAAARSAGAATAAVPVVDTVARVEERFIRELPPRDLMYRIQTPQAFRFHWVFQAHREALARGVANASDDARLVLESGHNVQVVEGSPTNIKVSTPHDLDLVELLLKQREPGPGTSPTPES
jgi:2-C-methyl-D-erythritol 4-phosphate cytidylyltransferase